MKVQMEGFNLFIGLLKKLFFFSFNIKSSLIIDADRAHVCPSGDTYVV